MAQSYGKKNTLDYGALTPVLKRLDRAGYVTRKRAKKDERLLTITLTATGRALKENAASIPSAMPFTIFS